MLIFDSRLFQGIKKGKKMFNLLSNQTSLLAVLSKSSKTDFEVINNNLQLTIKLLSRPANELLAHRKENGSILTQRDADITPLSNMQMQQLTLEQLLVEQGYILCAINSLCLTEAIIVRDNFINCLEIMETEIALPESKRSNNITYQQNETLVEKSNVAPIYLTQIKQKLAKALTAKEEKRQQVKAKLNALSTDNVSQIKPNKVQEVS